MLVYGIDCKHSARNE